MNFDGSNDYISIGTPATVNLPTTLSITCWFQPGTTSGIKEVISSYDSGGNLTQYTLAYNRSSLRKLEALANGAASAVTGATVLTVGVWYHAVLTRAGSTGSWTYVLYLNGVQDATATVAANPDAQQSLSLGRPGAFNGNYIVGALDDIRFYNRALSAGDVAQLYQRSQRGYPDLLRRWPVRVGHGTASAGAVSFLARPSASQRALLVR